MEYHAATSANLRAIAAEHEAKVKELGAKLAAIEVAEGNEDGLDSQSNKRLQAEANIKFDFAPC
eukprot:scaffold5383_cov152-Skeletonema_dohrnii-CCMP3373.AAC.4